MRQLTQMQKYKIERARAFNRALDNSVENNDPLCAELGTHPATQQAIVYAQALGRAHNHIEELLGVIEELRQS